jgi:hypothetical protein
LSSIERQLEHAVDRDEMHRLIDALRDDQTAILIAQTDESANPDAPDGQSVTYQQIGRIPLWKALGMIETAKVQITEAQFHGDCCSDDADDS